MEECKNGGMEKWRNEMRNGGMEKWRNEMRNGECI